MLNCFEIDQSLNSTCNKLDGDGNKMCIKECIKDFGDIFRKARKSHVTHKRK